MVKTTSRAVHHDFSNFLDIAHEGGEVLITKRGKPWARLMPLAPAPAERTVVWPDIAARLRKTMGNRKVKAVETLLKMREEARW